MKHYCSTYGLSCWDNECFKPTFSKPNGEPWETGNWFKCPKDCQKWKIELKQCEFQYISQCPVKLGMIIVIHRNKVNVLSITQQHCLMELFWLGLCLGLFWLSSLGQVRNCRNNWLCFLWFAHCKAGFIEGPYFRQSFPIFEFNQLQWSYNSA